tara:strand:- start:6 stop:302 length:297 start_codon:yes stop_codon:yes gene_type:complete
MFFNKKVVVINILKNIIKKTSLLVSKYSLIWMIGIFEIKVSLSVKTITNSAITPNPIVSKIETIRPEINSTINNMKYFLLIKKLFFGKIFIIFCYIVV